jgi:hypothetical protein
MEAPLNDASFLDTLKSGFVGIKSLYKDKKEKRKVPEEPVVEAEPVSVPSKKKQKKSKKADSAIDVVLGESVPIGVEGAKEVVEQPSADIEVVEKPVVNVAEVQAKAECKKEKNKKDIAINNSEKKGKEKVSIGVFKIILFMLK